MKMDKVRHLWNVINQLSSNPAAEALSLQSYYVERCRQMENEVQLPQKIFGSGTMCSYCGSLWSKIDHRVRFGSGRSPAKSVQKILSGGKKIGRVRETLAKKAVKNSGNKAIIRCSFCSKCTKIRMSKPARQEPATETVNSNKNQTPVIRKRKKRTKDKTAGLIIIPNQNPTLDLNKTPKMKPTNLNKLGAMIKKDLTPSKRSSLHDFITELRS